MSTVIASPQTQLSDTLKRHAERIRKGAYIDLGRLEICFLHLDATEKTPAPGTDIFGRSLNWLQGGPKISLSANGDEIYVTSPALALPEVEYPDGRRGPQRESDRTDKQVEGTGLLIFQPVRELYLNPFDKNYELQHGYMHIRFSADMMGRSGVFLWNPSTGEAFVYGGRFEIA